LEGVILRSPDIPAVLSKLAASSNPVEGIRELVLRTGGFWHDTVEASGLFEIHLVGITGLGSSAQAALEDWIIQARRAKVEDLWVALEEG
jgi:hypothetical protein